MKQILAAGLCILALCLGAPAMAQNLSLRAPQWAQALLGADVTPTTGGRALINADGVDIAVRATIAPTSGGVARVIRYDLRADQGLLALRRFTGHPSTGWWLWGGDGPRVSSATPAQRAELATLARAVMGVGGSLGGGGGAEPCPRGEQAYVEVAFGGRAASFARSCVSTGDAAGRLALRLSEMAGSRTEEELAAAAVEEVMQADRAFAAKAAAEGVPAAFAAFAASDAIMLSRERVGEGQPGVAEHFANWPQGARLEWAPQTGRVSARGDMGWTWGNAVFIAPDGTRAPRRYLTIWTRDYEGNWRFALDAGVE